LGWDWEQNLGLFNEIFLSLFIMFVY